MQCSIYFSRITTAIVLYFKSSLWLTAIWDSLEICDLVKVRMVLSVWLIVC